MISQQNVFWIEAFVEWAWNYCFVFELNKTNETNWNCKASK